MKVLLIGGLGFLGRRFIQKFGDRHKIIVFTNEKKLNRFEKDTNIIIEIGELDEGDITEIIKKYHPDVVLNLVVYGGLQQCQENPQEAFFVNVFKLYNIINACINTKTKLIYFSSREVYGNTKDESSSEDDLLIPNNVLGITKLLAEDLVKWAGKNSELPFIILRPTNVYGPEGINSGINKMIKNALNQGQIKVFGGSQMLNLIYVDDVIEIVENFLDNKITNEIFNVGSQHNIAINDVAEIISKLTKNNITIVQMEKRIGETNYFKPNLKKLESALGYSSKTSLEKGIKKTIEWVIQNNLE